jgi:hypothetical protein
MYPNVGVDIFEKGEIVIVGFHGADFDDSGEPIADIWTEDEDGTSGRNGSK